MCQQHQFDLGIESIGVSCTRLQMGTDGFAHCEDGDTMCSLQHGGGTWTSHIWTQTSPDPFHVHRLKLNQFGASVSVSHVVNVGSCRRGSLYCVHEPLV